MKVSTKKKYQELLFHASAAVLPSVVMRAPEDATPGEMVDDAILLLLTYWPSLATNGMRKAMVNILKSIGMGILLFVVVGLVLGLGTLLFPLVIFYITGKWYRENIE